MAVAQCNVEHYSPDAKLDEEKLSVLTCYLRANKHNKFSSDQDRVIWYWLDTILIHKRQLELTFNKLVCFSSYSCYALFTIYNFHYPVFVRNLMECKPCDVMLAATVCRFLSVVSDGKIPLMTDKRTDFMMIALASWMQSIHKTCSNPTYEGNRRYNLPVSFLFVPISNNYYHFNHASGSAIERCFDSKTFDLSVG